ncbi:hypothetical protein K458DRAFT_489774 [Lentithecium fluviatile CBS 122367]|uniref:Uncharacterized protein n=1 Tax=Lentithecium fluviatile CBS 122367 TaxID=1168545 RepID=A0A6G1IS43_9PLEO|nr:hypothetical protein K458DRAFT_489774 [Lentithecium fluviatile CBS 122367]
MPAFLPVRMPQAVEAPTNQIPQPQPQDARVEILLINILTVLLAAASVVVACLHFRHQKKSSVVPHLLSNRPSHRIDSDAAEAILRTPSRDGDSTVDVEYGGIQIENRLAGGLSDTTDGANAAQVVIREDVNSPVNTVIALVADCSSLQGVVVTSTKLDDPYNPSPYTLHEGREPSIPVSNNSVETATD